MDELPVHNLKEIAARYAVNNYVHPGMVIGLGSGSTAAYAVEALAERIRTENFPVSTIFVTSDETGRLATFHGIPVAAEPRKSDPEIDVTIDGADEVDGGLNLIKGGGGALLREKLVAVRTKREVIVVDQSKMVKTLGTRFPLPVMIVPFAWETTQQRVEEAIGRPSHRRRTHTDSVFISNDGLYCLDVEPGAIDDPAALAAKLKEITGVVESGLFIDIAQTVVISHTDGHIEVIERG
jgi:ribose 5-phosphate isomerase A